MKTIKSSYIILCSICLFLASCSSDEEITKGGASEELVKKVEDFLTGEIVLSIHATPNGVNKILLEKGCPIKFKFDWNNTDTNTFSVPLLNFTVDKMGMIINFECNVQTIQLNTWEKDEYPGAGWIKFYGEDGSTWGEEKDGIPANAKGSSVKGYYNTDTHQINFIVNYNMMNVCSECFLQAIDKTRTSNYKRGFARFEKDLREYKKERGLS